MRSILFLTLVLALFGSHAHAYWSVQRSDKDVFGNVNVTVTSIGANGTVIRFECGSSSEPFLAFLLRDNSESVPDIPAKFLHLDRDGNRKVVDAELTAWNENYAAVKVVDKATLIGLAQHMVSATKSISVGIEIPYVEHKVADTFSSSGSTAAGRTVLRDCFGI